MIPLLKNNNLRLILGLYADDLRATRHRFRINCTDRPEIYYEGGISPDEPLAPRLPRNGNLASWLVYMY